MIFKDRPELKWKAGLPTRGEESRVRKPAFRLLTHRCLYVKVNYNMDEAARKDWEKLRDWKMPFGKFSGRHLYELPAEYLCWFEQKGWPEGELGKLLRIVLEAKREGADEAFDVFRRR